MTPHPLNPSQSDDWQAASGGEVVRLTRRLKGRKSRRQFLRMGGGIVGVALIAAGGWVAFRFATEEREYDFAGITCRETIARAETMMKGGKLSNAEMMQVKEHVMLCPRCKPKMERMGGLSMFAGIAPRCQSTEMA